MGGGGWTRSMGSSMPRGTCLQARGRLVAPMPQRRYAQAESPKRARTSLGGPRPHVEPGISAAKKAGSNGTASCFRQYSRSYPRMESLEMRSAHRLSDWSCERAAARRRGGAAAVGSQRPECKRPASASASLPAGARHSQHWRAGLRRPSESRSLRPRYVGYPREPQRRIRAAGAGERGRPRLGWQPLTGTLPLRASSPPSDAAIPAERSTGE